MPTRIGEFKAELQEMAERVRSEPTIDPEIRRVMVPGDPEKLNWKDRNTNGIPVQIHGLELIKCNVRLI